MERLVAIMCAVVAIFIVGYTSEQAAQDQNQGIASVASFK